MKTAIAALFILLLGSCTVRKKRNNSVVKVHHATEVFNQFGANLERKKPKKMGGLLDKSPHMTITKDGVIWMAHVAFNPEHGREYVEVFKKLPDHETFTKVSSGRRGYSKSRAWGPKLISDENGHVWLAYCGRDRAANVTHYNDRIYFQKIFPSITEQFVVNKDFAGRGCLPSMTITSDRTLHIVWEQGFQKGKTARNHIVYRKRDLDRNTWSRPFIISSNSGFFNRRPVIASFGPENKKVAIAWDSWRGGKPDLSTDPNYDIQLLYLDGSDPQVLTFKTPVLESAPFLARGKQGELYLAWHQSDNEGILKHWRVGRLDGPNLYLYSKDPVVLNNDPKSESQGDEFPTLAIGPQGQFMVLSRPSHGAFIHRINKHGVETFDLTRFGWGARGLHSYGAWIGDDLFVARRGRQEVLLEMLHEEDDKRRAKYLYEDEEFAKREKMLHDPPEFTHHIPLVPATKAGYPWRSPTKWVAYGDVHMHSAYSDGAGTTDEIYARAFERDLDFAVLTDHDNIVRSRLFPSQYREIAYITDFFNQIPGFTTLHAFEWTSPALPDGHGHRNVYFENDPVNPVFSYRGGHDHTKKLFDSIRELPKKHEAFAVPHHTGWTGTDWENADEDIQRHIEIASVHGVYENRCDNIFKTKGDRPKGFVSYGLSKRKRFGFFAGSDAHGLLFHHGNGRHRDPWIHGLTGVYLKNINRQNLWNEMYKRHTFATTGEKAHALLKAGNLKPGDAARKGPYFAFSYKVPGEVKEVTIVRNGIPYHMIKPPENHQGNWRDYFPLGGENNYYLRVLYESPHRGIEAVWTSPIFLELDVEEEPEVRDDGYHETINLDECYIEKNDEPWFQPVNRDEAPSRPINLYFKNHRRRTFFETNGQ